MRIAGGRRRAVCCLLLIGLFACGGGNQPVSKSSSSPTPSASRLACANVKAFVVTGQSINQGFETDPTADAAIARAVSDDESAESSTRIGDEPKNHDDADRTMRTSNPDVTAAVRFALLDASGKVVNEVVVGQTPDGWRAVRYDSCG